MKVDWREFLKVLASLTAVVGFLLTWIFKPGVVDWLYPLPLVILLALALALVVAFGLRSRRRPSAGDQKQLDRILAVLPRDEIRRIRGFDFGIAWPEDLVQPVSVFDRELGDVEHRFNSRAMEKLRVELRAAADDLIEEETGAFQSDRVSGRRDLGISSGALETAPLEERNRFERRRQRLHSAATKFCEAHDSLVERAKDLGYDLSALEAPPARRSWTETRAVEYPPAGVRAQWPGEARD
jgi:hypothetical protein